MYINESRLNQVISEEINKVLTEDGFLNNLGNKAGNAVRAVGRAAKKVGTSPITKYVGNKISRGLGDRINRWTYFVSGDWEGYEQEDKVTPEWFNQWSAWVKKLCTNTYTGKVEETYYWKCVYDVDKFLEITKTKGRRVEKKIREFFTYCKQTRKEPSSREWYSYGKKNPFEDFEQNYYKNRR